MKGYLRDFIAPAWVSGRGGGTPDACRHRVVRELS
jgi:hypothetical protein